MVVYVECVLTGAELCTTSFDLIDCFDGIGVKAKSELIMKMVRNYDEDGEEEEK